MEGKPLLNKHQHQKKKKKRKNSRTVRITVRDTSRKVNHLSMVIWDRKIITEFTSSISSTRIGKPVCMMDIIMSPKTKTLADGLIERNSSMLDEIESKTMGKDKEPWFHEKMYMDIIFQSALGFFLFLQLKAVTLRFYSLQST